MSFQVDSLCEPSTRLQGSVCGAVMISRGKKTIQGFKSHANIVDGVVHFTDYYGSVKKVWMTDADI